VLEETNDIAFQAVEVLPGAPVEAGIWFRLALGGITGHKDFARDTGVIVKLADAIAVADAIVRVFIDAGDRTNRAKARMKYVLDDWGFDKYLAAVEEKLGRKLTRIAPEHVAPRAAFNRSAHIGVHRQKQAGLNWVGVLLPVGKITSAQLRSIAGLSRDHGDGDIRLTVWQNFLFSGVPDAKVAALQDALRAIDLTTEASAVRAGLVACTGNTGCKFAASNTKDTAALIADHCDRTVALDSPINIHLTGCHHSCAQHYIGDIGLIGAKVPINDDGDTADGFTILVGGGYGADAKLAREILPNVKNEDCPAAIERLLKGYLAHRLSADETFFQFANRVDETTLRALAEATP
jgi:ferredoxin-nitrite reductase